jgi:hypothetical protein
MRINLKAVNNVAEIFLQAIGHLPERGPGIVGQSTNGSVSLLKTWTTQRSNYRYIANGMVVQWRWTNDVIDGSTASIRGPGSTMEAVNKAGQGCGATWRDLPAENKPADEN